MAFRLARRTGRTRRDGDAAGAGHAQHVRLGDPDHRPGLPGRARAGLWRPRRRPSTPGSWGSPCSWRRGFSSWSALSFSGWVREVVPRAGLLGSLAAIALVIISFLPLLDIAAQPVAGFVALRVILATLTARWRLPAQIPGALAAVALGCLVYYGMHLVGLGPGLGGGGPQPSSLLRLALPAPVGAWWDWFQQSWPEAVSYLPVAIPLALATVVGGIDCTESAAAAGDDYPTGQIIAAEGWRPWSAGSSAA